MLNELRVPDHGGQTLPRPSRHKWSRHGNHATHHVAWIHIQAALSVILSSLVITDRAVCCGKALLEPRAARESWCRRRTALDLEFARGIQHFNARASVPVFIFYIR